MPALRQVRPPWYARVVVTLSGVWLMGGCTPGYQLSDDVLDAPADYCGLLRGAAVRQGLTVSSPSVVATASLLTHKRTHLTVQSVLLGDDFDGRHAVVVAPSPGAAGVEVLRFSESDPGSGATHWIGISDDGHSGYVSGSTSSDKPFVQADRVLRLQFFPAQRTMYRLRPCVDTAGARARA